MILLLIIVPLAVFNKYQAESAQEAPNAASFRARVGPRTACGWLAAASRVPYLLIVTLVVYSFNDSPLPTSGAASR